MHRVLTALGIVTLTTGLLTPAVALAQNRFDLRPGLTKAEFETFAGELGAILRFRQLGDAATLGKGNVEVGLRVADTRLDGWNNTRISAVTARFGASERVDIGVWGGVNQSADYGLVGADTTIALLSQDKGSPVSFSLRPNGTWLLGRSEVWAGTASLDLSVSRAFGPLSPYAGVGTTASVALERSAKIDLEPGVDTRSLSYAGVAYHWRALVVAAEIEKGAIVSYGFRVGTRF
jgi:hypothetical protein